MSYRTPMGVGEWYHCYNRGVDKRRVFENQADYERFLLLMYVGNGSHPIHIANMKNHRLSAVLADDLIERGSGLVEIGAYAIMPNHFHLVLKEMREGGIASFMQRIGTAYTMYFNKKRERTGALFAGPFKSRHVPDDRYFKHLISYVHLNPAELFEPRWKEGSGNVRILEKQLRAYPYSSLPDFYSKSRAERKLLDESVFMLFDFQPVMREMIEEAKAYYAETNIKASP